MKMLEDFKKFAFRGNVIDLAVGVMIGGAFGKIVTSLVNDIFMPALSIFTGKMDISSMFLSLDGKVYESIDAAKTAGAATINYGLFLTTVIDFLLIAICIFLFVKLIGKISPKPLPAPTLKTARLCKYCYSQIADEATRCPHCTSQL